MTYEFATGQVGLILCLEASRLARNNAEWYRLLELCAVTDTLIGDLDGLYHPGLFNDRLLLGLKGTLVSFRRTVLSARMPQRTDPLGQAHLHRRSQRVEQSRLCRSLCLW